MGKNTKKKGQLPINLILTFLRKTWRVRCQEKGVTAWQDMQAAEEGFDQLD